MTLGTTRARLTVSAALVAVTLLAGCIEDLPQTAEERAGSDAQSSEAQGSEADESAGEAPATGGPAGRLLSQAEAKAALPGASALPTGWTTDPEGTLLGDEQDNNDTYAPRSCAAVFDSLDAINELDREAKAGAAFTRGAEGPFLAVEVNSFPKAVDEKALGRTLAALDKCPTFTLDSNDGNGPARVRASALSFPKLGDESAAMRSSIAGGGFEATIDMVFVRAGHNMIVGTTASLSGALDPAILEKAVQTTMTRLKKG